MNWVKNISKSRFYNGNEKFQVDVRTYAPIPTEILKKLNKLSLGFNFFHSELLYQFAVKEYNLTEFYGLLNKEGSNG